jgi:hypothetical protein
LEYIQTLGEEETLAFLSGQTSKIEDAARAVLEAVNGGYL